MTNDARFHEGEGLNGQAWQTRDLVVVGDLGEMKSCSKAPVARKAGLKSGVCFPITMTGRVIGTMDFFTNEVLPPPRALDALRNVGRLVSASLERVDQQQRIDAAKTDLESKVTLLMKVARAAAEGNLATKVEVQGDDDMGRLGAGLPKMIPDIREVISQVIEEPPASSPKGRGSIAESTSYLSERPRTRRRPSRRCPLPRSNTSAGRSSTSLRTSAQPAAWRRNVAACWPTGGRVGRSRRSRPWS